MTKKLLFCFTLTFTFFHMAPSFADDIRSELQKVAAKQDRDFPDGIGSLLTHFSVVCILETANTSIYVVDQRAVVAGMPAPRGNNKIAFYDKQLKLLGSYPYIASRPLWCEENTLFLFGYWDAEVLGDQRCPDSNCNAIEWNEQDKIFQLKFKEKYGSSGGEKKI